MADKVLSFTGDEIDKILQYVDSLENDGNIVVEKGLDEDKGTMVFKLQWIEL